nr:histidine kinase [Sphingomonas sanxanigenens]
MGRMIAGAAAMLLMMVAGIFAWESIMGRSDPIPPAPAMAAAVATPAAAAEPSEAVLPEATAKTREERRFGRYDKDKDGAITRDEYLVARRKAFAKLDRNGNGVLDFDEYAVKTIERFATADADASGSMNPAEFATTAVKRKPRPAPANCPPAAARGADDEEAAAG